MLDQSLALITALDMMEVDPDFEDGGDDEQSLGWTERGPSAFGENTDRERDDSDDEESCEDEGAQCDDEGVNESVGAPPMRIQHGCGTLLNRAN